MKKNYYLIVLIFLLGIIPSAQAVDVTVRVDLNAASDFYDGGAVWLMLDNNWSEYYDMTDADTDGIYEYTVSKDAASTIYFKFSYQTGADPNSDYVVEEVPETCSDANGLRAHLVGNDNQILPSYVYGTCFETGLTIRVDMSEKEDLYEGGAVWVYMDDNWEEYYDMMTDGDDIYYYTVQKDVGSTVQYSFSYQNGPDPNNDYTVEFVPVECANANGYREVEMTEANIVLPAFLYGSCSEAGGVTVPTYTTTFQVNMTDPIIIDLYEGGSVWLNINEWSEYYDMTDDDGDNIYTYELELDSGSTTIYKYSYQYGPNPDGDYLDETVPADCSSPSSEWNRDYTATKDSVLPAFLVSSCGEFGDPGTEKYDITFSVKLGGDSVSANGMWMVTKGPWSWRQQMDAGDDVYTSSMKLFGGQTIPYTYVYGGQDNWSGEESVPEACNFGTPEAPERLFGGTINDTVMPVIPFGGCIGDADPVMVTYQVNMSNENMSEGDIVWVYIWNTDTWLVMTDDDTDNVYTTSTNHIPETEISYYFAYGTDNLYDEEVNPAECSDAGGYRFYIVSDVDQTLPSWYYGSCGVTSISELESNLSIYPNPARDILNIDLTDLNIKAQINIVDIYGRIVSTLSTNGNSKNSISVGDLSSGIYIVQIITKNNSISKKIYIGE